VISTGLFSGRVEVFSLGLNFEIHLMVSVGLDS
jgi:hypothetical protein